MPKMGRHAPPLGIAEEKPFVLSTRNLLTLNLALIQELGQQIGHI